MARMYLAEFINNTTGQVFQKFGHTSAKDAQYRLDRITEHYPQYTARVLASAYHPNVDKCRGAEEAFKALYPKNLWIAEKISGVTEIVNLDINERKMAIQAVYRLKDAFKSDYMKDDY